MGIVVHENDSTRISFRCCPLHAGAQPPASTSANQILAWPLWMQQKGVVLLANFSGEPEEKIVVRFHSPVPVSSVRSLRNGKLKFIMNAQHDFELTLHMEEVTDVLVVE